MNRHNPDLLAEIDKISRRWVILKSVKFYCHPVFTWRLNSDRAATLRIPIWSQSAVIHANEEYKYIASDPLFLKYFTFEPQASEHQRLLKFITAIEYCTKRSYLIPAHTYVCREHSLTG